MKRHISMIAATLALFLLPALAAQAQTIKVSVPFDFSAGLTTLPAGDYVVSKPGASQGVLQLRSDDGRSSAFVLTSSAQSRSINEQSKLIFHRYGNQYFLSQVWAAGSGMGHQLHQSKAEREIAKNMAKPKVEILSAKK
jgi:hypothetical protein